MKKIYIFTRHSYVSNHTLEMEIKCVLNITSLNIFSLLSWCWGRFTCLFTSSLCSCVYFTLVLEKVEDLLHWNWNAAWGIGRLFSVMWVTSLVEREEGSKGPAEGKAFSFSEKKLCFLWLCSLIHSLIDWLIDLFIQYLVSTYHMSILSFRFIAVEL